MSSLLLFVKYYAKDPVDSIEERYWKRMLYETRKTLWWWLPLRSVDRLLTRIPLVRWLAWNMVMWGEKAAE